MCSTCSYRHSTEVKKVREEKDPLKLVDAYALEGNLATVEELDVCVRVCVDVCVCVRERDSLLSAFQQKIKNDAIEVVEEAIKLSLESTDLPPSELYSDVYTDQVQEGLYIRGCDPFTSNQAQQ